MPGKKYYDEHGIELDLSKDPASAPTAPVVRKKSYYDENGSPLQLDPTGIKTPFGGETATPQTQGSAEQAAPYFGRFVANSLPAGGSILGGPGGTLAGTGLSEVLKHMAPNLFGEPSSDPGFQTVQNLVLNDALPGIATGVQNAIKTPAKIIGQSFLKKFPAVREGIVKELSQQMLGHRISTMPQSQTLDAVANSQLPDIATGPAREFQKQLAGLKTGAENYGDVTSKILKDVTTVRQFKLATGAPWATEQLALNKLFDGSLEADGAINAKNILKELGGSSKEIYTEAMSPGTLGNLKDLAGEIMAQEKNPALDRVINYSSGKLAWALPAALLGGHIGPVAGTVGTVALTNQMLKKVMSDPNTAQLVIQAMRTSANTPKGALLQRALSGLFSSSNSIPGNVIRAGADLATVPDK